MPLVAQLLGRLDAARRARRRRTRRRPRRAPRRARPARRRSACRRRASTLTGRSTDSTTCRMSSAVRQPGREQHVGARPPGRPAGGRSCRQILAAVDVVLGPGGQHHPDRAASARSPPRPRRARAAEPELVDRVVRVAASNPRPSNRRGRSRAPGDRLGDAVGIVGERVLEVGRHRQLGAGDSAAAWASASSRVTAPSSRPSVAA